MLGQNLYPSTGYETWRKWLCSYAAKTRMFNAYPRDQVKIWLQLTTEHGFEFIPRLASILNTTRIHRYNTESRELITNNMRTFDHVGRSVPWTPVLFEGPLHFKIPQQWSPTKACNRCHCLKKKKTKTESRTISLPRQLPAWPFSIQNKFPHFCKSVFNNPFLPA